MDNKNQPAFPVVENNIRDGHSFMELHYKGLSKREYFAGLAMQGLCASLHKEKYFVNDGFLHYESLAIDAVGIADALLNELNK